ncbi:MAG: hypothetical protein BMS9Abin02_1568 [Anaerolineae bacterium]|nr:MAG: hypothetical protein BMS9Abin02_1568 [Anaerolineae bacterium]
MKQHIILLMAIILTLSLTLVGCGIKEELPEGAAETAESAVQSAGEFAKTAVSDAGDFAQTAAVVATEQGSAAVATLKAIGTPDIDEIKDKIASIQPDNDGRFSLTISDRDLNRVLLLRQLITGPDSLSLIRNVAVEFQDGLIIFRADTSKPLEARAQIAFQPVVEDGSLQFEIVEASVAGREVPLEVLDAAGELLNAGLGEAIEYLPPALQLQSVTVGEGALTLAGGRKP